MAVGGSLGQELQAQAADGAGGLGGLRPGALPASLTSSVPRCGPSWSSHRLGFSLWLLHAACFAGTLFDGK